MRMEFLQVYIIFILGIVGVIASLGLTRKVEKIIGLTLSGLIILSSFTIFFSLAGQVEIVSRRVEQPVEPPQQVAPTPPSPAAVETVVIETPPGEPSDPALEYEELCKETLLAFKGYGLELSNSVEDEVAGRISEDELGRRSRKVKGGVNETAAAWRAVSSPYPLFEQTKEALGEVQKALQRAMRWCELYASAEYEGDMEEYLENYRAAEDDLRRNISRAEIVLAQRR